MHEMTLALREQLAALDRMTLAQLRERFFEVVGESTTSRSKRHLVKRLSWWLQVRAFREEDRVERIRKRGLEIARLEDIRLTPPECRPSRTKRVAVRSTPDPKLPPVGTRLIRQYRGAEIAVTILEAGRVEWNGVVYSSLSAAGKAITGSHLSGPAFFKLTPRTRAL